VLVRGRPRPFRWDRHSLQVERRLLRGSAEGIERAVAWGDPAHGEYGQIIKYRNGVTGGWHTHPNDLHLVAISGTLVVEFEGPSPRELTPGSGCYEPAKVKHRVMCKDGADCMALLVGLKKYELVTAKEPTAAGQQ
jgi:quercetin dioxygenase-like cupin family protein